MAMNNISKLSLYQCVIYYHIRDLYPNFSISNINIKFTYKSTTKAHHLDVARA